MFIFRKGFGGQLLALIAVLLILPVILTAYMLHAIKKTELALVENHKAKLAKVMDQLDEKLPETFDQILSRTVPPDAPRRDKVQALNRELKKTIADVSRAYPDVELGFYSQDLDVILDGDTEHYGENFSRRRKQAFDDAIGTRETVMESFGKPEGGFLESYKPLERDDQIIGAVWARENLLEMYTRVDGVQRDSYLIIFTGAVLGIGGSFFLLGNFLNNVNQVKKGVKLLEYDLNTRLPPATGELGEITGAINHLAGRLVKAQNYNKVILANIDDGIMAVDPAGTIVLLNPAFSLIFGIGTEFLEKNLYDAFPPDSQIAGIVRAALDEKRLVKDFDITWATPGNGTKNILVSTSLLADNDREMMGVVLTCRDITERLRMREKMQRQERLAALGKLVAGVAHEIRNPITSISGYIQFWQKKNTPSPRSIATIYREVTRLNSIVDKLLHFVKPSQINPAPVDVNLLVDKVSQFFADTHQSDSITVVTKTENNLPPAWVDFAQVEQVLMNIMYNAWQALEGRSGTITLNTSYNPDTENLILEVADNGCGIPAENMSNLFDPFFTTRPKGTGLGLAIAYEIIRAHGGNIEVESEEGAGTSVRIYLQRAKEAS
ncbi:signal transduction histidine kinase [Pelotomaculum thermopropionicum SI]|uniref:histidine kinase n=1 Tax=Pelotomaculum thermopropionicum (strain DSM 13744 / JCM 10971 / SI) TaxID=370438 RepID=A5CZX5_PELTS|nr:signal transduction histidine kinase [Pelotomaculum thermopropionicum SI]